MSTIHDRMREIWLHASRDLGFELRSPFSASVEGRSVEGFALLPEFGDERGMVVLLEYDPAECEALAAAAYGYSCLSLSDEPYDQASFIEMLSDWGWSSQVIPRPKWLTRPNT